MMKKTSIKIKNLQIWMKILGIIASLIVLLALGLTLGPVPYYHDGFRSLTELREYAATLDEWIQMDRINLERPEYESYYQKNVASTACSIIYEQISFLLSRLGLKKSPTFSVSFFKTILENVTKNRVENGWTDELAQKIEVQTTSRVIVFGPIQGAFHSLVRDLEKLKELNLIDENLKLINPNFYLVFLGNAINRSPYTLETFTLILKLMEKNPLNTIYLKGTNEFPSSWKNLTLKRALEIRAKNLSSSTIPLEKEVQSFFDTLPIITYCTTPFTTQESIPYLKLAPSIDNSQINELLSNFNPLDLLLSKAAVNGFNTIKLSNNSSKRLFSNKPQPKLLATICDIKKRDHYEQMDGLRMIPPLGGSIAWTIMSCPTEPYRIGFKFFNDAFTVISPANNIDAWEICLYFRDVRSSENKFFNKRLFNLFSGKQLDEQISS